MARRAQRRSRSFEKLLERSWVGRKILVGTPYAWLLLFFLFPFLIVLYISFTESVIALPPFKAIFGWVDNEFLTIRLDLQNYRVLFEDDLYRFAFWQSLKLAALSTMLCLLSAYPMAYYLARVSERKQKILLLLVMLPFWTSFLLRVYAWMGILGTQGIINNVLMTIGLIRQPLELLYNDFSVCLGMVYCYLPFMILPLYTSIVKLDPTLMEAAEDLGARPWRTFWHITLPLTKPGIIAGCVLVFVPSIGEFVIPEILGGSDTLMIGKTIWTEFFNNRDWPVASAIAVVMTFFMIIPILYIQKTKVDVA